LNTSQTTEAGRDVSLHFSLDASSFEELVTALAECVAERLSTHAPIDDWLDVEGAAKYLACKPKRIYELKAQGRLRYAKDGTRLLIRREWLDEALDLSD
jgi:excisionase family DNA binding protein